MLIQAGILIGAIQFALWVLPFGTVLRRLAQWSPPSSRSTGSDPSYPCRVVWAVTAIGRRVLGDRPCLPEALAVQWLLRRHAYPAVLHLGVRRDEGNALRAHAWVTSDDRVVIGGADAPLRYTSLPSHDLNPA